THMDAPSHFMTNATTIDKINVSRFISNAVIIRTNKKGLDELITVDDIVESNTDIAPSDSIVFSTGWENEVYKEHYFSCNPGLSPEAAEYLIKRRINAVAIDSPSIDKGTDLNFTCHKILLSHEVLIVENLCNLGQVTDLRFKLVIAPLKFSGATGSPVRAIAIEQGVF
ncbi:MAG: cyclase family protein, partial [Thermoproteota archaeon]|nr:cyclase family protein [Thermoproteota archaeon]